MDDYPAKWKNLPQDSVLDDWKEFNRECTSFVAFRLASRAGFKMPFFDDAINWGSRARALGFTVNMTPAIGSVAWTEAHGGHVAWVADVEGSTVTIEQYNADFHGHYSWAKVPVSSFMGYIHFHDLSPAASAPVTSAPPAPIQGSSPPLQGSSPVLQGGNGSVVQPAPPGPGSGGGMEPPPPPPPPPSRSIQIGWSGSHPGWVWMSLNGFSIATHQYTCSFASGGDATFTLTETESPQSWDNGHTCYDLEHGDTVWVVVEGVSSNSITVP